MKAIKKIIFASLIHRGTDRSEPPEDVPEKEHDVADQNEPNAPFNQKS